MCQISRDPNLYVMFGYGVCASSGGICVMNLHWISNFHI